MIWHRPPLISENKHTLYRSLFSPFFLATTVWNFVAERYTGLLRVLLKSLDPRSCALAYNVTHSDDNFSTHPKRRLRVVLP